MQHWTWVHTNQIEWVHAPCSDMDICCTSGDYLIALLGFSHLLFQAGYSAHSLLKCLASLSYLPISLLLGPVMCPLGCLVLPASGPTRLLHHCLAAVPSLRQPACPELCKCLLPLCYLPLQVVDGPVLNCLLILSNQ